MRDRVKTPRVPNFVMLGFLDGYGIIVIWKQASSSLVFFFFCRNEGTRWLRRSYRQVVSR